MVAQSVDDVLGLPKLPALDESPRMQDVVAGEPDQVRHRLPHGPLPLNRLAEHGAELWAGGTKVAFRRDRQIDLKTAWKQEDSVDDRARLKVEEAESIELAMHPICQLGQHRGGIGPNDTKVQVDVRSAVLRLERARASDGRPSDPLVASSPLEKATPHAVSVFGREHGRKSSA